jgi:DNA-binding FadR family transcriptional regulator
VALQPVNRKSVPEDVFDQLVGEVLRGDLQPGDTVPSERRLAEVLGVSRPAVREALKRVTAAGLVEVRQGDATTVRDYRKHAGLDLLPHLLVRDGTVDVAVARSILEIRLHNGPKVAELAAQRGGPELAARLGDAIAALTAADDPVERQRRALTYWDHLVDAGDSIAFRLMYNTLRSALRAGATCAGDDDGRRSGSARGLSQAGRRRLRGRSGARAAGCRRSAGPRNHGDSCRAGRVGEPTMMARKAFGLDDAAREFIRHPSPPMIGATLLAASTARILLAGWTVGDVVVPLAMLAAFPFAEWIIHVCILHWRPRQLDALRIDPLLARKHREHHLDPRRTVLIFIRWRALLRVLLAAVVIALVVFPALGLGIRLGLTYLMFLALLGLGYEWTHYLIHSDYKPKNAVYRAIWRNHRQHHYQNERYWFTVTSSGTADRVFGTYPDPTTVPNSPTAKNLHALSG